MVSRNNSWRLVAVLAALGAAPLAAQAPVRLSFADAVRRAAGEAPTVALATLRTDEADAQVRQARSGLFPSERKSTRLKSRHGYTSYSVFFFKKKKTKEGRSVSTT